MRRTTRATLIVAATVSTLAAALATASPASAGYKPQPFRLVCASTASGGTLENGVCVLPYGVTTAPDSYSATITATGAKDLTLAVASGGFPAGLTLPATSTSGSVVITGNPAKAGVYDFTIKASAGSETATLAYEITITAAGPPDQLLCALGGNGGVLESGICVLPDAVADLPYAGYLLTSHQAGGTLSVITGSLPPA